MKKALSVLLAALLFAAMLTGCTQTPAAQEVEQAVEAAAEAVTEAIAEAAPAGQEAVELTFWRMSTEFSDEDIAAFCKKVTEKYPYITLKTEALSYDSGPEKLTVAMATNATPDIYLDVYSRIAPAVGANLLADMTDLIDTLKGAQMAEGYASIGNIDGKNYYAALLTNNGYNLGVNMSLVEKYGLTDLLPEDHIHWSYDEFLAFLRAAKEAGAADGVVPIQLFAGSRSSDASYYSLMMTAGTQILSADHKSFTGNTAETVGALELLKTMVSEGLSGAGSATFKDEEAYPYFWSQKNILFFANAGAQDGVQLKTKVDAGELEGFKFDFYAYPSPDGTKDPHVVSFGTLGFCIFKNENDPAKIDAAKKVIEMFYEDVEMSTNVCKAVGYAPCNVNVALDYGDAYLNDLVARANEWNAKYADDTFGILEPYWSDVRETFYPNLQGLYTGDMSAQETLDAWQKDVTKVLDANQ